MLLKVTERQFTDEQGLSRRFHYYLTVDQLESPLLCCENYGVLVVEENGGQTRIPAITTSAQRIDELMTLLVEHLVGPSGLQDVVEDWI